MATGCDIWPSHASKTAPAILNWLAPPWNSLNGNTALARTTGIHRNRFLEDELQVIITVVDA
jgi:hypothetical protein